jgi:hypothetical protein
VCHVSARHPGFVSRIGPVPYQTLTEPIQYKSIHCLSSNPKARISRKIPEQISQILHLGIRRQLAPAITGLGLALTCRSVVYPVQYIFMISTIKNLHVSMMNSSDRVALVPSYYGLVSLVSLQCDTPVRYYRGPNQNPTETLCVYQVKISTFHRSFLPSQTTEAHTC